MNNEVGGREEEEGVRAWRPVTCNREGAGNLFYAPGMGSAISHIVQNLWSNWKDLSFKRKSFHGPIYDPSPEF